MNFGQAIERWGRASEMVGFQPPTDGEGRETEADEVDEFFVQAEENAYNSGLDSDNDNNNDNSNDDPCKLL